MTGSDIVRFRLLSLLAVTALVDTRIYSLILPEGNTLAAIRLSLVPGAPEEMHLRGRSGVLVDRVQVDAYAAIGSASPLVDARAIASAAYGNLVSGVATGLVGWAGSIGSPATKVDLIEPAFGPVELYLPDELKRTVVSQDFYVHYRG